MSEQKIKRLFRLRLIAFLGVHLAILSHLYLWYGWGQQQIGAIDFAEMFRNFLERNTLTAGAVFGLLVLGAAFFWGRFLCGWFCHIGLAYDLLDHLMRKIKIRQDHLPLRYGPWACLIILVYFFIWPSFSERPQGTIPFQIELGATAPLSLFQPFTAALITLAVVLVVLPLALGPRPFCRHLCPWGIMVGWTNRWSRFRVRKVDSCTRCGECTKQCPMDIDVSRAINSTFDVRSAACIQCQQCVAVCPVDALAFSGPQQTCSEPIAVAEQKGFYLPRPIELLFWLTVALVGWVYDEMYAIGHFLAFSIGLLVAWYFLRLPRLWQQYKKLRALWVMLVCILVPIIVKDGYAHYHFRCGFRAFSAGDYTQAEMHYEKADPAFWVDPTVMWLHLYVIYKQTGKTEKQAEIRARYEQRQKRAKAGN
ncbi:MAG: 4Fe-4S binding protein [Acidobacteria bacterium]|nr:4Fe-4S binding protein [Acidobacteriota bacterium]MCB9396383.1 4Fe-4S binding protein [Acidobacteriota bacterium]